MTDLEVRATEAIDPLHLLDRVAQGEFDLAFANPTHDARLESCPLIEDPYIVLVAAGHPLTAAPCVSATALAEWPLIAYRTVPDRLYPAAIEIDPEAVVYRTDDDAAIRAMVASGVGIAVLPRLSVDLHDHRTRTVPIEPPFPARTITLFWRRGAQRNAAVAEFIVSRSVHAALVSRRSPRTSDTPSADPGHQAIALGDPPTRRAAAGHGPDHGSPEPVRRRTTFAHPVSSSVDPVRIERRT